MNVELTDLANTWYQQSEDKARQYFASLQNMVLNKNYIPELIQDFHLWKREHITRKPAWLSLFSHYKKRPDSSDYYRYLGWLNQTGKLDDYLDRSILYIYLRDLGKDFKSPNTQIKVNRLVADVKRHLIDPDNEATRSRPAFLNGAALYRWAQKEGVENGVIWVMDKLRNVSSRIPRALNPEEAERKLIKIIIGVVMHVMDELDDQAVPAERARQLEEAIKLGYYYGLTYPFIDDLLDSDMLNAEEKAKYSSVIRETLLSRTVPPPEGEFGSLAEFMTFVYDELREAYEFIKTYQRQETQHIFFEQSYVFFHAQDIDRAKSLLNAHYTNEELYLPVILKSSSSRLVVRSVVSAPKDERFDMRVFYYGLYNQLADDFADMFEDMEKGAVTPYTYYLKYRHLRPDLINPFELYWTVIANLIHRIYGSDAKIREIILDRAINGLKRYYKRAGEKKYNEVLAIFTKGMPELFVLIQKMVRNAEDVDFYDKLLRDQLIAEMKSNRQEKEQFSDIVATARRQINELLQISKPEQAPPVQHLLIETANYSLESGGKRLRPVLSWIMGVKEYGLSASALVPLFKSLEYMHTASLIFDDLPTQDNSPTRRGRPTLHHVHNSAIAELTGIYLIQKAIEELSSLKGFDNGLVLKLIRYMSQKAGEICMGQAMDLNSKGKALTQEELNAICFYKTGIAFEVSLVAPAILAQAKDSEIERLKKIAYHAGIAFQIKDDLLDGEGDERLLGKPAGKDIENNNSTFVTVLGREGARREMWEHYCLAMESWSELPNRPGFLKHLLNYLITRDN